MYIKKYLFILLALFMLSFTTFAGSNVLYQNINKLLQNNNTITDNNQNVTQLHEVVVIPKEFVDAEYGFMGASRAHVIRPNKTNDIYKILGLNKNEVNSIQLGWGKDHRPSDAYKIIDYYMSEEIKGNWHISDSNNYKSGYYNSIDPLKANAVNAALMSSNKTGKYDVYLYGMYGAVSLEGWTYGIYWDIDGFKVEVETEKQTVDYEDEIGIVVSEPEPEPETVEATTVYNDIKSYQDGEAIIDDDAELFEGSIYY